MERGERTGYRVRTLLADEVGFALELAAREGWNPGLSDAESFYAADPNGFFVGELDGEPIGCISAVSYKGTFGFIGLYIVVPEHRGKGYGWKLWQHAMAYLDGQNTGLDGVVEQQANYRKSGFTLAHRNIRYGGSAEVSSAGSPHLAPAAQTSCDILAAYDRQMFPAAREPFLRAWLQTPGAVALTYGTGTEVAGYGMIRPCREGAKIGPLFADSAGVAEELFCGLSSRVAPGTQVFLDVPETNPAAPALAERHGMTPVFETARMYTGDAPDLPAARIFGITTFELG